MSIGSRIKQARKAAGLSQVQLAERLGISKGAIGNYESGVSSPREQILYDIMRILNVDANFIFQDEIMNLINAVPVDNLVRIPVIGTVRAGFGGIAYEDLEGYELADVKDPVNYIYFHVKGDSMAPHITDGDLALVRKQDDIESGELAVVIINGDEGTIKKVIKRGDSVILQPFNPEYQPVIITGDALNEFHVVGKVVETVRKW